MVWVYNREGKVTASFTLCDNGHTRDYDVRTFMAERTRTIIAVPTDPRARMKAWRDKRRGRHKHDAVAAEVTA